MIPNVCTLYWSLKCKVKKDALIHVVRVSSYNVLCGLLPSDKNFHVSFTWLAYKPITQRDIQVSRQICSSQRKVSSSWRSVIELNLKFCIKCLVLTNVQCTSAMRLALKSKQTNENWIGSVQGRDSGNLFANFTREPSAILTGKQDGACCRSVATAYFDNKPFLPEAWVKITTRIFVGDELLLI